MKKGVSSAKRPTRTRGCEVCSKSAKQRQQGEIERTELSMGAEAANRTKPH